MIDLTGKTRDEIEAALKDVARSGLIDMIVEMATLEQWFRPSEIARRRRMNVRDVRAAMRAGKLGGGYFRRAGNVMLASSSGVAAWDRLFFISVNGSSKNGGVIKKSVASPRGRFSRCAASLIMGAVLLVASVTEAGSGTSYLDWHRRLPRAAKEFVRADNHYWRQWWKRGFSPQFAWKNTDPKQVHMFSRPLLRGEQSAE